MRERIRRGRGGQEGKQKRERREGMYVRVDIHTYIHIYLHIHRGRVVCVMRGRYKRKNKGKKK